MTSERGNRISFRAVSNRTKPRTWWPLRSRVAATAPPMNPLAPVTKILKSVSDAGLSLCYAFSGSGSVVCTDAGGCYGLIRNIGLIVSPLSLSLIARLISSNR
jgi:hypothetical protein